MQAWLVRAAPASPGGEAETSANPTPTRTPIGPASSTSVRPPAVVAAAMSYASFMQER